MHIPTQPTEIQPPETRVTARCIYFAGARYHVKTNRLLNGWHQPDPFQDKFLAQTVLDNERVYATAATRKGAFLALAGTMTRRRDKAAQKADQRPRLVNIIDVSSA